MSFTLGDHATPILGAPMAGGPSTPALAAAVSGAGGLGFLPAGYLSAQRFADNIAAARALSSGPIGVNLFVPQPCIASAADIDRYRELVEPLAQRYGVQPGHPHSDEAETVVTRGASASGQAPPGGGPPPAAPLMSSRR